MYNIILVDLDNTILDFYAAEEDSFRKIISEMGLKYSDDLLRQYQKINNSLWRKLEQGEIPRDIVLNTRFSDFFRLYDIYVDGIETEQLFRFYLETQFKSRLTTSESCVVIYLNSKFRYFRI